MSDTLLVAFVTRQVDKLHFQLITKFKEVLGGELIQDVSEVVLGWKAS